jgi:hypothetical protein
LYRVIDLKIGWQAFQVTRNPATARTKQPCDQNTAGILLQACRACLPSSIVGFF